MDREQKSRNDFWFDGLVNEAQARHGTSPYMEKECHVHDRYVRLASSLHRRTQMYFTFSPAADE